MRTLLLVVAAAMALAGCASTKEAAHPTLQGTAYRITTSHCDCELYTAKDPVLPVRYTFSAAYEIDTEFITRIALTLYNGGTQRVSFTDAYVRVASRNVSYQYNNRFVPLTADSIAPQQDRSVTLVGRAALKQGDPYLAVAGEELVLTVKGIKYGARTLAEQTITFVPRNPKLAE